MYCFYGSRRILKPQAKLRYAICGIALSSPAVAPFFSYRTNNKSLSDSEEEEVEVYVS